jgi:NAD(P)H-hydrate epimerase
MQAVLDKQAVAYGMGMGVNKRTFDGARYLLNNYTGKLLLDADALNSIAQFGDIPTLFKDKRCQVVVTPHVKEFSRLSKQSVDEILDKGLYAATEFAKRYGIVVALKGAVTTVTDGESIWLNDKGSSGQAKGGSGDALSGVIAALMGQGLSPLDAAKSGVYLTGVSAELVEKDRGQYAMISSDVIDGLGKAFLTLYDNE